MAAPDNGEVRVWIASLDLGAEAVHSLARLLSDDERERAARFRFRREAIRFVASRAVVRTILAECLRVEPWVVHFAYGPHGKPELAAPFDRSGLRFNVSQSASLGLYAVAAQRRVGVDIERLRPLRDLEAIGRRVLSPRERQTLSRLLPAERLQGFFNCWTRKEAYIKAIGDGLSYPLDQITVSLDPRAESRLEHVDGDLAEAGRWTLEAVAVDTGYTAAIAIEGRPSRLACLRWNVASLTSGEILTDPRTFEAGVRPEGSRESRTVEGSSPC
jgi:4'-phosphopantetheinyl transferase